MIRRLALHLALVAGLALSLAPSAPGQALDELWTEYPLYPAKSETTTPRAANATSLPAAEPKRLLVPLADTRAEAVGPAAFNRSGPSEGFPLIFVLASVGALVLVLLVTALGRAPVLSAAATVAAAPRGLLAYVTELATPLTRPPTHAGRAPALLIPPPKASLPEPGPAQEACVIRWWRGYVKSEFCAEARDAAGRERVVASSPEFWWRKAEPPPRSGPALDAYRTLVASLERDGWEPADSAADRWYETGWRRPERPSLHALAERLARGGDPESGT